MSDFIDGLERDLVAAARRRAEGRLPAASRRRGGPWGPWSLRTVVAAVALTGATAAAAGAGTLYALRGSVIPAPDAADVPREQTPVPGSGRVASLRVADPAGDAPPWTLRIARSDTGYLCSTVGQVQDGDFGIVGLDRRFRPLADGIADSCGQEQRGTASLLGARVFDGRTPREVRTVVNGVAGRDLRRVDVETAGGTTRAAVDPQAGAFAAVLRGYPEDLGLRVRLRFADGRTQREDLGWDPTLVLDPEGGRAWRAQGTSFSDDGRSCASFSWARQDPRAPRSPVVCGALRAANDHPYGVAFAVRRLAGRRPVPGPFGWSSSWRGAPARTAVWGSAGEDVRRVTVLRPGAPPQPALQRRAWNILAVLPGDVDPADLRVRVELRDGRTRTYRGDTNLVRHPVPLPIHGGRK
ncbi:hypothetical protein [Patulibacter sp. SYSU D01012]|uniref:hypothetical protein n=1 Tax=Patulibacter sp. SYSU D01012 TaxID=2817381 RepID=UPI001B3073A3|nr:hypothetical protein [Patulibacter sp. SYSU D01012]